MGEFKESEHPRDKDGKFTDKGITKMQKHTLAKNYKDITSMTQRQKDF